MEQKLRRDRFMGENLRVLRDKYGISQEKLCAELQRRGCDIGRTTYAKYESGELNIEISVIIELKKIYGCTYDEFFDGLFISGELGFEKPDVRYFERVRDTIEDFCPEHTILIGDSLTSDIKGANNFGLDSCWYNPKGKEPSDVATPTYIARDFDAVYSVIERGEV